jgi:hypothetical protein
MMTPRPVLTVMSILAGLQILAGGAALGDVVGAKTAGLIVVGIAAIQGGVQFWVQGQVTPMSNVAARRVDDGRIILGPAATPVLAGDANAGEPAIVNLKPSTFPEGWTP